MNHLSGGDLGPLGDRAATGAIVLDAATVRRAVSVPDAIEAVRAALLELAAGHFEQPVRTAMRTGQFLVMPAHHRPTATAIVKTLSINADRSPVIAGTVTWSALGTSATLIADAPAITSLRTGAISGVATDLLAPKRAETMAIIGAGAQARDQVLAVHTVRPLRQVRVFSRTRARAQALARTLGTDLVGVEVLVADSAAQAVRNADIVTCSTPATEPVLRTDMLQERVHVNAIGSYRLTMRELPDDLLADATVVVDDIGAILEEAGEIRHALDAGALTEGDLTVLGNALTEAPPSSARTVFKTVGIAVQDWAVMRLLASRVLPAAGVDQV